MSAIDLLTRVDTICKKYDKYDVAARDPNVSGDDAFDRLYASVESDIETLLQKSEMASSEKSRASAAAINAEIRRTKARLLEEVPRLQRLAVKKVKGLSTEEFAVRNDPVLALPDRIQAIPDGSAAAPKPSRGWGTSAPRTETKFDSDGQFDDEYFQKTEESSQFRQEYKMRKFKQDQGLDVISKGLGTLKNMASDMNEPGLGSTRRLFGVRETNIEDRRRRTLEALDRRFAQAKADVETKQTNQHNKSKKRSIEDQEKVASNSESPYADKTLKKPLLDASHKKGCYTGNISFLGHPYKQANELAYLKLSHPVHEKLLPNGVEVSFDEKVTVNRVLHELLQHGDVAQKYIHGAKNLKIENTILLDNFVPKSSMSSVEALQNGSKRSKKHMSRKQHKKMGSFDLPKESRNFETFKPMHDKWKDYVVQLLKIVRSCRKDQLAQCFLDADLHGAIMLVVQCKTVSLVGINGIMVRETRETFGIMTRDNKFQVVPKKGSVFALQSDCWKITLIGDKLSSRRLTP